MTFKALLQTLWREMAEGVSILLRGCILWCIYHLFFY